MKTVFVPKALDGIAGREFCVDTRCEKTKTQPHWHGCIEIIYIRRGCMQVFFNNKWNIVNAGELIFIPTGRIHCCTCEDDGTAQTVIGITEECICAAGANAFSPLLPFFCSELDGRCIISGLADELESVCEAAADTTHTGEIMLKARLLQLYGRIYEFWVKSGLRIIPPAHIDLLNAVIGELQRDIISPPSPYETARKLNISYSHMCRILREELGCGYTELLNRIRLDAAKKYLLTTRLSVTETGYACGFCDSSYFIKMFRKSTGITPYKYRASSHE